MIYLTNWWIDYFTHLSIDDFMHDSVNQLLIQALMMIPYLTNEEFPIRNSLCEQPCVESNAYSLATILSTLNTKRVLVL